MHSAAYFAHQEGEHLRGLGSLEAIWNEYAAAEASSSMAYIVLQPRLAVYFPWSSDVVVIEPVDPFQSGEFHRFGSSRAPASELSILYVGVLQRYAVA